MAAGRRWKLGPEWVRLAEFEARNHPRYETSTWFYILGAWLVFGFVRSVDDAYEHYPEWLDALEREQGFEALVAGTEAIATAGEILLLGAAAWAFYRRGRYFQPLFGAVAIVNILLGIFAAFEEPGFGLEVQYEPIFAGFWLVLWVIVLYSREINLTICHRVRSDELHLVRRERRRPTPAGDEHRT